MPIAETTQSIKSRSLLTVSGPKGIGNAADGDDGVQGSRPRFKLLLSGM
jgi:hypothetical protein